jgi:hypothetical protein
MQIGLRTSACNALCTSYLPNRHECSHGADATIDIIASDACFATYSQISMGERLKTRLKVVYKSADDCVAEQTNALTVHT